ncbi:hypothetical protein [Sorangium sp. So ce204]|uniref:hypothetical protein n=1 Tax=Sorangium sp. So ce204 TaxID=3133288 RepID=UPI003F63A6AE
MDSARAVAIDSEANIVLAGAAGRTTDPGTIVSPLFGSLDIFVATYADDGAPRWVRQFGGHWATVTGVAIDGNDGIAVVGEYSRGPLQAGDFVLPEPERDDPEVASSDTFVLALDRDGAPRWMHRLGGGGVDFGGRVAIGPGNDVIVAAESAGRLTLTRFAADGTTRFAKDVGSLRGINAYFDPIVGVAVDLHGDILVAGDFYDDADLGGGATSGLKGNQAWVAKYSGEDGAHLWSRHFGQPADPIFSGGDSAAALLVDERGDVLLAGRFAQGADLGEGPIDDISRGAFLMKLAGEDGAIQWTKAFPAVQVRSTSLSFAPDGRLALISWLGAAPSLPIDLGGGSVVEGGTYVATYEPDTGAFVAQRRLVELGGTVEPAASTLDAKGHVLFVVNFIEELRTGFGALKSEGWSDFLLAHVPL